MKIKSNGIIFDSKKPKIPFDDCVIKEKLSSIETYKTRLGKSSTKHLLKYFDNPLYFKNCFQFMMSGLHRAVHGLYATAGVIDEKELDRDLDDYLSQLERQDLYWVKTRQMTRKTGIKGRAWISGNSQLPKNVRQRMVIHLVHKGDIIYVRKDATNLPMTVHVELFDRHTGKVKVLTIKDAVFGQVIKRSKKYGGKNPLPSFTGEPE